AGLGLTNAFTVHLSSKQAITPELKILLTHEYMHRWVTPKIVSQNTTDQEDHFWLTEGFTDYYAALLALRGGLINLTEYVQYFNRTLEEYMLSSAIDIPNSEIKETFWMNYDVGKIAYQRGFLLANHWNSQLKKKNQQSKHLDTWFKNIVIGWHQYQYWATHARMIANMRQLTNVIDIEGDIEQYIQQ